MLVYAPKNIAQNRPLVIACHDLGGTGQDHCCYFNPIADTARFVGVYPSAIGGNWDLSDNTQENTLMAMDNTSL